VRIEDRYDRIFGHVRDTYAVQLPGGHNYARENAPLTPMVLRRHLLGELSIGLYLLDGQDHARYGVLDHDGERILRDADGRPLKDRNGQVRRVPEDGLDLLQRARAHLALQGIEAAVERSRRGAHLWLFAREAVPACEMRALLLLATGGADMELYPKQDSCGRGVGSLIRAPLGVHLVSGQRYGFVNADGEPVARTMFGQLTYLERLEPVNVSRELEKRPYLRQRLQDLGPVVATRRSNTQSSTGSMTSPIRAWVASVRIEEIVRSYIPISHRGVGHCPWPEHHKNGDAHPSFAVSPRTGRWYCYTAGLSGDAFDFVGRMEGHASARETLTYVQCCWPRAGQPSHSRSTCGRRLSRHDQT